MARHIQATIQYSPMFQETEDTRSLQNSFRLLNVLTGEIKLSICLTNIKKIFTLFSQRQTQVTSRSMLTLWTHHLLLFILVQLMSQLRHCNLHTLSWLDFLQKQTGQILIVNMSCYFFNERTPLFGVRVRRSSCHIRWSCCFLVHLFICNWLSYPRHILKQ